MDEKGVIKTTLTEYETEELELLKSAFDMGCAFKMLALQKEAGDWELKYLNEKKDWENAQAQIGRFIVQVDLLKGELAKAKAETAREILTELKNTTFHKGTLTYDFEIALNKIAKKYGVDLGEIYNG